MSRTHKGYSVLEVLLAGAVFALAASGIVAAIIFARESTQTSNLRQDARALAEEGLTAVKTIRDRNWSSVTTGNGQALSFDESTSQWSLIQNPSSDQDTKGRLTRRVDITSGDLPETKNVTVRVEYPINRTDTKEIALDSLVAKLSSQRYGGGGSKSQNYQLVNQTLGKINRESTTPPLLLDEHSGAAAAYSVRRLTDDYIGPALTIRRASDDSTTDIGFTNDETLDTSAISSFCGTNTCYVQTWHDQSGNDRDATQSTKDDQPLIYDGDSVVTENSKPAVQFDGSDDILTASASVSTSDLAVFSVVKDLRNSSNNERGWTIQKTDRSNGLVNLIAEGDEQVGYRTPENNLISLNSELTSQSLVSYTKVGDSENGYVNGSSEGSDSSTATTFTSDQIGIGGVIGASDNRSSVNAQSFIIYDSDQSSNRSDIESNINDYFDIY